MPLVTNLELFKRLLPESQGQAFYVLWWETIHRKPDGKFRHDSAAFRTLLDLANAADQYAGALNVRNLFFCVSVQREANFRERSNPPQAIRNIANTVAIKVFFLDLDVKGGAYATTGEAERALLAALSALGLPAPSIGIYSSASQDGSPPANSSLHCYWVLTRTLTPEEWRPLAMAFKAALKDQGLVFDLNVPSNVACILRPLGSFNRKYDPPRIARLAFEGPDCAVEIFRSALAHVRPPTEPHERNSSADLDEVTEVVEHLAARGYFDRGRYSEMLALHFALAHLVSAKPELRDEAWDLIRRVVEGTGRDLPINESRFEDALTRTADRLTSDGDLVTAASLFRAAYASGWLPPHPEDGLDDDQLAVLDRAKYRLRGIFDAEDDDRDSVAEQIIRTASRVRDERVRAALAPSAAYWLALDGKGEAALLAVIELLSGRRDVRLARWALSKRLSDG